MQTAVYPLPLPEDLGSEVRLAAKATGLSQAEVMRQALRFGLPVVQRRLTRQSQRVTTVDPLPDKVLRRLYQQPEADEEGVQQFIAAQAIGAK
jgi:hypothetical protein